MITTWKNAAARGEGRLREARGTRRCFALCAAPVFLCAAYSTAAEAGPLDRIKTAKTPSAASVLQLPDCTTAGQTVTLDVSTGTSLSGGSLPATTPDPKWQLVTAPPGVTAPAPAYVAYPLTGTWAPAPPPTSWISINSNGQSWGASGAYTYELSFNINNLVGYSSLNLSGLCHADDAATISLNGTTIPSCNGFPATPNVSFSTPSPFQSGLNKLDVKVNEIPGASNTGFFLAANVTAVCLPPPPPIACCAPLNQTNFTQMLSEKPVGNIQNDYVIKFHDSATATANATFDSSMQAYFNYVSSPGMDPGIQNVDVFLFLYDCGAGTLPPFLPSSTLCPGAVINNIKVLSWNAWTNTNTSPPGTPISGEIIPPYTPGTWGPVSPSQIFADTPTGSQAPQQSQVNHLYQVIAIVALDRPSQGANRIEFLDQKCGIAMHQTNHLQSQRLATTTWMSAKQLEQSEAGRIIRRQLDAIAKSNLGKSLAPKPRKGASLDASDSKVYRPGEIAPTDNDAAVLNANEIIRVTEPGAQH